MKKAILFKKIESEGVQCLACAHYCKVYDGKKGLCGVRQNRGGILYSLVYGKAATYHVDPIEKKPLSHFLPGTPVMSFGTVGCNFKCSFCQNWDISQISKPPHNQILGNKLTPQNIVDLARKYRCPSIAYTYNEPAVFFEYAYDTMRLGHKVGIKNIFVSNGYLSAEARDKAKRYLDAANIDLKSFSDKFYKRTCGASLQPVLDTIRDLYLSGVHIEITTLVIPGLNDSESELRQIAEFILSIDKTIPWHLSRFFPSYEMLGREITPLPTLNAAKLTAREVGLERVYIGNV